ncbi:MAG: hypothetical protein EKK55_18090 [Rhodocyclaceae bacterium]|nr:MAG: hypothetical protein EKK55_18090 [Rhodocyclaceae bacterium]
MADLVVTCPAYFWADWIAEGDPVGADESGEEWGFTIARAPKVAPIEAGERLYVVAHGRLRGYAPVTRVEIIPDPHGSITICRRGGAVAVTIDEPIKGFRNYRRTWWKREAERPFPDWRTAGVPAAMQRRITGAR